VCILPGILTETAPPGGFSDHPTVNCSAKVIPAFYGFRISQLTVIETVPIDMISKLHQKITLVVDLAPKLGDKIISIGETALTQQHGMNPCTFV
jgi:hypothetical protein